MEKFKIKLKKILDKNLVFNIYYMQELKHIRVFKIRIVYFKRYSSCESFYRHFII